MFTEKALTITKTLFVSGVALSLFSLVGCNTTSERDYIVENSEVDDYVYIVDYEKIATIEEASRTSHSNVDTVWINPPVKRIKRSELEKMQKQ